MCEYCDLNNMRKDRLLLDKEYIDGLVSKQDMGDIIPFGCYVGVCIAKVDKTWYLAVYNDFVDYIPIHYCPSCGRKLEEKE